MSDPLNTRRGFVQRAAYIAPAILTLAAAPSFAKYGSEKLSDKKDKKDKKEQKRYDR